MDARRPITDLTAPLVHHVEFCDGQKYFTAASEDGYSIWTSETCEKYTQHDVGGVGTASMLGSTQIIGLTGKDPNAIQPPNKVALYDVLNNTQQAMIATSSPVIRVKLTAKHIIIIMDTKTASNPLGLGCVDSKYLVIPGRTSGQIQTISLADDRDVSIVPAHTSALQCLAISPDGSIIASASRQGTLVRLHSTSTSARLGELRRGVTPATIFSIAISPTCSHIAVTSNTNTLHVFEVPRTGAQQQSRPSSVSSYDRQSPSHQDDDSAGFQKWGSLAKLPFVPRVFSDVYSVASTNFDPGREDSDGNTDPDSDQSRWTPPKGVVGWYNDETIVVVNAGRDARYERFAFTADENTGKPACFRVGWSRFMRAN